MTGKVSSKRSCSRERHSKLMLYEKDIQVWTFSILGKSPIWLSLTLNKKLLKNKYSTEYATKYSERPNQGVPRGLHRGCHVAPRVQSFYCAKFYMASTSFEPRSRHCQPGDLTGRSTRNELTSYGQRFYIKFQNVSGGPVMGPAPYSYSHALGTTAPTHDG